MESRRNTASERWNIVRVGGKLLLLAACLAVGADWVLPRTLCRAGEWHGPVTDHFDGVCFYNPETDRALHDPGAGSLVRWASRRHEKGEYPLVKKNAHSPELSGHLEDREVEVTMINHSTMLIRFRGLTVLTDPVWSDYTSPVQFAGPKRTRPVGMAWEDLPRVDVCLLSHDHYDHFDVDTLKRLAERDHPLFIVPLGLKSLLEYHCGKGVRVAEKDWWETVTLPDGMQVTLTPAHHWSRRYRTTDTARRSLWCGFYLSGQGRPSLYYAGDTARCSWFKHIRRRLGAPDMALLPIGAYRPDWIRRFHQGPDEAVQTMEDLGSPQAVACHFGTWQLANEGYQETIDNLRETLRQRGIPQERFRVLDNGETYLYSKATSKDAGDVGESASSGTSRS